MSAKVKVRTWHMKKCAWVMPQDMKVPKRYKDQMDAISVDFETLFTEDHIEEPHSHKPAKGEKVVHCKPGEKRQHQAPKTGKMLALTRLKKC